MLRNLFAFNKGNLVFMGEYPISFTSNDMLGTNEYRARPQDYRITYCKGYVVEDGLYKFSACAGSGLRGFIEVRGRRVRLSEISYYSPEWEDHYRDVVVNLKEGKYIFLLGHPIRYGK